MKEIVLKAMLNPILLVVLQVFAYLISLLSSKCPATLAAWLLSEVGRDFQSVLAIVTLMMAIEKKLWILIPGHLYSDNHTWNNVVVILNPGQQRRLDIFQLFESSFYAADLVWYAMDES